MLILDEPTKGVDIGTRAGIYAMLRDGGGQSGVAVVVVSSDFEELLGLSDRVVVISDGRSTADLPSAALDPEKLTLLAAPAHLHGAQHGVAAGAHQGAGRRGRSGRSSRTSGMICLNAVAARTRRLDPGFKAGEACVLSDTRIPAALRQREPIFVHEADAARSTMLVPIRSPRGHDLGWVGLSLTKDHPSPPPAAVKFRIDTLAASL